MACSLLWGIINPNKHRPANRHPVPFLAGELGVFVVTGDFPSFWISYYQPVLVLQEMFDKR